VGLQRHGSGAEAPVQLLRHAAHSAHLRHRLRQRAGVHRRVQREGAADHHQLPDRQPGRGRPPGGHAGYALGRLLRGRISFLIIFKPLFNQVKPIENKNLFFFEGDHG